MLVQENAELRKVYLNLRKKLLGVVCSLQEISDGAAVLLNLDVDIQSEQVKSCTSRFDSLGELNFCI